MLARGGHRGRRWHGLLGFVASKARSRCCGVRYRASAIAKEHVVRRHQAVASGSPRRSRHGPGTLRANPSDCLANQERDLGCDGPRALPRCRWTTCRLRRRRTWWSLRRRHLPRDAGRAFELRPMRVWSHDGAVHLRSRSTMASDRDDRVAPLAWLLRRSPDLRSRVPRRGWEETAAFTETTNSTGVTSPRTPRSSTERSSSEQCRLQSERSTHGSSGAHNTQRRLRTLDATSPQDTQHDRSDPTRCVIQPAFGDISRPVVMCVRGRCTTAPEWT